MSDTIAPQLIRHEATRPLPLSLQQLSKETLGGAAISPRLNQNVDDIAVLIDRSPQVLPLILNLHEHFVQIPEIAETTCFLLQPTSVLAAKPPAPLADRLIGDDDASLGQQIFDLPEPVFPPDPQPSGVRKHHAQPPWWTARNFSRSEPGVSIIRSKATSRIVGASGRASGRSKSGNRIPPLLPAPRSSVYPVEPVIEDRRTATGAHG